MLGGRADRRAGVRADRRAGGRAVCLLLLIPVSVVLLYAHKFHNSISQIDYNAGTRSVEIAVQLFADDLEAALAKRAGRTVRIDRDKDAGDLTLAYLRDVYEIKNAGGTPKKLQWVGMEIKVDSVWAYVEAPMPEGLRNAQIRLRQFFELFNDQVNIVAVRQGKTRDDIYFRAGDRFRLIQLKERQ